MIDKIKKGKSFGGYIRYVMGKDNAEIIGSDGVLLGNNREIADSFNCQCLLNPEIKQPVGHIALSFKPEDKPVFQTGFYRTRNAVMELLEKLKVIMNEYKKMERRNT